MKLLHLLFLEKQKLVFFRTLIHDLPKDIDYELLIVLHGDTQKKKTLEYIRVNNYIEKFNIKKVRIVTSFNKTLIKKEIDECNPDCIVNSTHVLYQKYLECIPKEYLAKMYFTAHCLYFQAFSVGKWYGGIKYIVSDKNSHNALTSIGYNSNLVSGLPQFDFLIKKEKSIIKKRKKALLLCLGSHKFPARESITKARYNDNMQSIERIVDEWSDEFERIYVKLKRPGNLRNQQNFTRNPKVKICPQNQSLYDLLDCEYFLSLNMGTTALEMMYINSSCIILDQHKELLPCRDNNKMGNKSIQNLNYASNFEGLQKIDIKQPVNKKYVESFFEEEVGIKQFELFTPQLLEIFKKDGYYN